MTDDQQLAEQIGITAELTGTDLSAGAAKLLAIELAQYDRPQVLAALSRCRMELRGRLTMAAILDRLPDGRPGPDEAWAMLPMDEDTSAVWTDEMCAAFGVALPMLRIGDKHAARLAFRECYLALVAAARAAKLPPSWSPTLGLDAKGREQALADAVDRGRLSISQARAYCPALPAPQGGMALVRAS